MISSVFIILSTFSIGFAGQINQCEQYEVEDFMESLELSGSNQRDDSKGYQRCMVALDSANSKASLKNLQKDVESACGSLRKPPEKLVPEVSCCSSLGSSASKKDGDLCGGYDPVDHSICLYHNSQNLSCPVTNKKPDRAAQTLYEEYFHSYQTCLQRSGDQKYRSLPYKPSDLIFEFETKKPAGDSRGDNKAKYRCSQVSPAKHQTWCVEMSAKCNNPYAESIQCESFCNNYASDDKFEAGCCLLACQKKQKACCDWFDR